MCFRDFRICGSEIFYCGIFFSIMYNITYTSLGQTWHFIPALILMPKSNSVGILRERSSDLIHEASYREITMVQYLSKL